MWKRYFPYGQIYGLDIYDKRPHEEDRIRIFQGSQADESFLQEMVRQIGRLDIVIDDGSHRSEHVIKTFEVLFPLLHESGIYAIEDLHTSYSPDYGGSSEDLESGRTSVGMLKKLVDGLHYQHSRDAGRVPSYVDRHIVELHFYHNLVIIQKGLNSEENRPWPELDVAEVINGARGRPVA
jgi:hypothetical protein